MKVKYTFPSWNEENIYTYLTHDISKGSEDFFSSIPQKIKTYCDVEVFIINYDINEGMHDNFFMAIEVCHEKVVQKFQKILDICLPGLEIKKHTFHNKYENSLYIYEVQANYLFEKKSVKSSSILDIYRKLTRCIFHTCLENEFYHFSKNMYEKLEYSSIVFKSYTDYSFEYYNPSGNKSCSILLYLMAKFVIDDIIDFKITNLMSNCKLMAKSFYKELWCTDENDYKIISKFIHALYKIGLNNFNFPKHVKEVILYYCAKKYGKMNNNWYIKCSSLGCNFYKNDQYCNDVVSPFNHIFNKIKTSMYMQDKIIKYDYYKPIYIRRFFSSHESGVEDIMFLLLFFCTLSISNNKFSIIYNDKKYSNTPPILINTNIENIQQLCEPILRLIPDNVNNFEKNLKPQNVLNSIKERGAVSLLDVEDCKRFNLIKLLTNYDENSKKCRQKITGVGYYSNSLNKRHHSFGIYGNNRLKSYLSNKRIVRNHFNKSYCFDLYIENINFEYHFEETLLKDFFEYTSKNINENYPFEIDLSDAYFNIANFAKETEIESLRSVRAYSNLLFSCIIFCSAFDSFFDKSAINTSEETIDRALYLCIYIEKILLKSQKSFGSNATMHKHTILRRLNRAQPAYSYLTERELYKFVNQAITNRDVAFAINELIYEKILTEIIPLARGKRKGPKGRMFLVNKSELGLL